VTTRYLAKRIVVLLICLFITNTSWAKSDFNETIETLSAKMSAKIQATGKKKVAVVNFTNTQGDETALGKFIAEEFSVELAIIAKGFSVVDRSRVTYLLKENGLTASGLVNPEAASQLGKLSSIDALVIGSFTPYGENLRVNVKVLDLQTADILTAARGLLARTSTIDELGATALKDNLVLSSNTTSGMSRLSKTISKGGASDTKVSQSLTANGFKIDLERCERRKSGLDCFFIVTAMGKDNFLTVYGAYRKNSSRVYDDKGLENFSKHVYLAEKSNIKYLQRTLISNIPTKIKLQFNDITTSASKIALLRFSYHSKNSNKFDFADFRDVAFINK